MAQYPIGRSTTGSYIELPAASAGALLNYDTVIAVYKNTTTITVKAGGQYTVGGTLFTVAADFDLSIASDLSVDDTLTALTWYHVITNGVTWKFADATACSDVTGGVALKIGVSIYNDAGLKIRTFTYDGLWYRYAHDAILLLSATMPTVNTTISLAAYVPSQVRQVEMRSGGAYVSNVNSSYSKNVYVNDIACGGVGFYTSSGGFGTPSAMFQTSVSRSFNFRCLDAYTDGKLYLQAWSV